MTHGHGHGTSEW